MPRLNPDDARQGSKGTPVLTILLVALALCVVVFIGLGFYAWVQPDETVTPASVGAGTDPAPTSNPAPATTNAAPGQTTTTAPAPAN